MRTLSWAVGVALGMSVWGTALVAEACSDDGGHSVVVRGGDWLTTTDGVIAVHVSTWSGPLDPSAVAMSVVQGVTEVEGDLHFEVFEGGKGGVLVFRPDAPMEVGDQYSFTVTVDGSNEGPTRGTFEVVEGTVGQDLTLGLSMPRMAVVEQTATGPRICCDYITVDSCGTTNTCISSEVRNRLSLSVELDESRAADFADPTFMSTYAEVYAGVDGEANTFIRGGQPGLLGENLGELTALFDERASRYCLRVDVVSLVDGTRHSTMECADDPGVELETAPRNLEDFVERCETAPYWEDDGEPLNPGEDDGLEGCSCRSNGSGASLLPLLLPLLLVGRRRRA